MTPIKAFATAEEAKNQRTISPQDVANIFHKCPNTIYALLKRSVKNRRDGNPQENDFPCAQMVEGGEYTIYENRAIEWGKRNGFF